MQDLIERSDAIKMVRHISMELVDADTRQKLIEAIPAVEPKRGKWIWQSSMAGSFIERRYRCSNCQYEITTQREEPIYNYCPNCGARMKGADDE